MFSNVENYEIYEKNRLCYGYTEYYNIWIKGENMVLHA